MRDDATLITIGELARRTGLTVRTLRFYADSGLVVPAGRSDAGYRLYDAAAAARAELVRTLRELGVDLPTIRRVLARELGVAEVAAAHAAALETQIRVLRGRRAVLLAAARRGSTTQEMKLMHRLAQLSDDERRRIVAEFVDDVFDGLDADPGIVARMRAATPELPDDPSDEQIEAWIELAELVADDDFRARIRQMARRSAADRATPAEGPDPATARDAAGVVAERAGAALAAGIEPESDAARPVVDELAGVFADSNGRQDGPDFRAWLVELLETFSDRRAERYWQLLAIMNGWPAQAQPSSSAAWEWLLAGLRAHRDG
ncbi:MAG: MerR family transcriptional regulator [Solirubrobacteraceae bacterium]